MKVFNFFITALLVPSLSLADICSKSAGTAKQWQEQKKWTSVVLTPSQNNPALQVKAAQDQKNQIYLDPIDLKGTYKTPLAIDIKSIYQPKRFLEFCADSETYGSLLTLAREDKENQNQFRMVLNYLPSPSDFAKNPYIQQKFVTDPHGIGVVVRLSEDSLVKKSESWIFTKDLGKELGKIISQDLQSQMNKGVTGTVTVRLDRMDDLACDLLRGRAQIRFFHQGKMDDARVKVIDEVKPEDLFNLYQLMEQTLTPVQTKDERLFVAGAAWMQTNDQLTSVGPAANKAFRIIQQMTDLQAPKAMKPLSEQDLECLAANESTFKKSTYNSWISLDLAPQTLTEAMALEQK